MKIANTVLFYLKYLTFAGFIYATIVMYPGLISDKIGIVCLVCAIIYILVSFAVFFKKTCSDRNNFLNGLVILLLHLYFMFLAYKYITLNGFLIENYRLFQLNYVVAGLAILILTFNKILFCFYDLDKDDNKNSSNWTIFILLL